MHVFETSKGHLSSALVRRYRTIVTSAQILRCRVQLRCLIHAAHKLEHTSAVHSSALHLTNLHH